MQQILVKPHKEVLNNKITYQNINKTIINNTLRPLKRIETAETTKISNKSQQTFKDLKQYKKEFKPLSTATQFTKFPISNKLPKSLTNSQIAQSDSQKANKEVCEQIFDHHNPITEDDDDSNSQESPPKICLKDVDSSANQPFYYNKTVSSTQKTKIKKNYETIAKVSHSRQGSAFLFSTEAPLNNQNCSQLQASQTKINVQKVESRIKSSLDSFVIPSSENLISQAKGINEQKKGKPQKSENFLKNPIVQSVRLSIIPVGKKMQKKEQLCSQLLKQSFSLNSNHDKKVNSTMHENYSHRSIQSNINNQGNVNRSNHHFQEGLLSETEPVSPLKQTVKKLVGVDKKCEQSSASASKIPQDNQKGESQKDAQKKVSGKNKGSKSIRPAIYLNSNSLTSVIQQSESRKNILPSSTQVPNTPTSHLQSQIFHQVGLGSQTTTNTNYLNNGFDTNSLRQSYNHFLVNEMKASNYLIGMPVSQSVSKFIKHHTINNISGNNASRQDILKPNYSAVSPKSTAVKPTSLMQKNKKVQQFKTSIVAKTHFNAQQANFNTQITDKSDQKDTSNTNNIEEQQISKIKSVSISEGQQKIRSLQPQAQNENANSQLSKGRASSVLKNAEFKAPSQQSEKEKVEINQYGIERRRATFKEKNYSQREKEPEKNMIIQSTGVTNQKVSKRKCDCQDLLESEKQLYGDRCPKGYDKLQLLGKGGCAIVWLAQEQTTGLKVALKQFPKPKGQKENQGLPESARTEIEIGRELFMNGPKFNGYGLDQNKYPGIKMIARLLDVVEDTKDHWLVYEVGAAPFSKQLFEVKGETYKGERIYGVQHQQFYISLKEDKEILKDLIKRLAQIFQVLSIFKIVHADIKPDNILIDLDEQGIKDLKLIDFGSAFSFENPSNISASTPEYLAPEVLEYLENRGQNTEANGTNSTNLCKTQEPWSYDTWSLGTILLEMLTGIPIWMSLKCRTQTQTGKSLLSMGIFGVQGRVGKKILAKQQQTMKNLSQTLKKYDCYGLDKDPDFMDLLLRMLDSNPKQRISPEEILNHPFLN